MGFSGIIFQMLIVLSSTVGGWEEKRKNVWQKMLDWQLGELNLTSNFVQNAVLGGLCDASLCLSIVLLFCLPRKEESINCFNLLLFR